MRKMKTLVTRYFFVCVLSGGMIFLGGGCGVISFSPPSEEPTVEVSLLFQQAQQLFDSGQFLQAISRWEQIPPSDPQYLDAQLAVRKARLQIEDVKEEQTTSFKTSSEFDAYITQAEHLETQGNFREALQVYEEARLLMPENLLLYNKIEELHALLEDALERHKSLGKLYLARGEYEKSKAEWERLLLIDPKNEQAKQRLVDIEVLTATSDRVFYQRGRSLLKKGFVNAARAEFQKALQVNPTNEQTLNSLAKLEDLAFTEYTVKKGDTLSSIAVSYTQTPSDFTILADFNAFDLQESLKIGQKVNIPHILRFKKALDPQGEDVISEPSDTEPTRQVNSRNLTAPEQTEVLESIEQLFERGVEAYNQGNYREAVKVFNQVYERDPEHQKAYDYFMRATTSIRRGSPIVALSPELIAEQEDKVDGSEVEALIQAGKSLHEAGKLREAITTFEQAAQLAPGNAEIARYLEETRDKMKKLITAHLNEGIKQFNREALEEAIVEWEKVLELDPSNRQAVEYKERAEKMLDQISKSIDRL